jgi:hypothetical protein
MCLYSSVWGFIRGVFLTVHISHFPRMSCKGWKFYCNRSIIKDTLLGERSTFQALSWLLLEEFLWKFIHAVQRMQVWWRSVVSKWHFSWRTKYNFGCMSVYIGTFFLKNRSSRCPILLYKYWKFGCESSLMKGYLLEERCTFSVVSRLPLERFSWKFMPLFFSACAAKPFLDACR